MDSRKKPHHGKKGPSNRAGGAATGGGINFQAAVTAIAVVYMARARPIRWLEGVVHDLVTAIRAETGGAGDDITFELNGGQQIEVQVKKGLRATAALWDALLKIATAITSDHGRFGLLVVCPMASRTIGRDLAADISRIGDGRTDQLSEIGQTWLGKLEAAGLDPRSVCSRLRIYTVAALAADQADVMTAKAQLEHLCAHPSQVDKAWLALYADSARLIEQRGRRDLESVDRVLKAMPIDLATSAAGFGQVAANGTSVLGALQGTPMRPRQLTPRRSPPRYWTRRLGAGPTIFARPAISPSIPSSRKPADLPTTFSSASSRHVRRQPAPSFYLFARAGCRSKANAMKCKVCCTSARA